VNPTAVEELFRAALDTPPGQREALFAARGHDEPTRAEVRRLLARHEALTGSGEPGDRFLAELDLGRAAALLDETEPADRSRIGRYDIVRRLGTGATGVVFLARDAALQRDVAVKLLADSLSRDATAVRRFTEEARVASALDHPRVVTVYEIGRTDDDRLFIAMAYHEGETLRARLSRGPLPVVDAVRIAGEVAEGLSAAHARGIVHRDVKPENILLTGRGARILDFGIAKIAGATLTRAGTHVGTVAYMSPEQTSGDPVDHRSDLWSLGVVLYEMLTGTRPFRADGADALVYAIRHDTPAPVTALRPDVPAVVLEVVARCLEKDPERRCQSADAIRSGLSAQAGITTPIGPGWSVLQIARRILARRTATVVLLILSGLAALAATGLLLTRSPARAPLGPDLIVVAPFDVLDPDQGMWREGLVDVLSSSLDGAGPLRAVPPSAVVKRWDGRADRPSASRLANALGAGLAVYGRIVGAGADSLRLSASLLDVSRGRTLAEFEFRGSSARIDQLADSLAVRVLAELSSSRQLGAERLNSLGSQSPGALKAFLQGEQHLRRMSLDSAVLYYERAVDQDSTFALALNRLGFSVGWRGETGRDSLLLIRAGSHNRGLAQRESLLVAADSLSASIGLESTFIGDSASWSRVHRWFATLVRATTLYPDDAGAWYRLGEARAHWGMATGMSNRETLMAFERATALDSSFAPAHQHLVELTLAVRGVEAGRRLIARLLDKNPTGAVAGTFRLTGVLLDPHQAGTAEAQTLLDTLPVGDLINAAFGPLVPVPDPRESIVRVTRAYVGRDPGGVYGSLNLPMVLAFRGHAREAYDSIAPRVVGLDALPGFGHSVFSELAMLKAVPHDTAAAVFASWLARLEGGAVDRPMPRANLAVVWWYAAGDTLSLARVANAADALARRADPADTARLHYARDGARAWLALARPDTAEALARFTALHEWPTPLWVRNRLTLARLLGVSGRDREAARILDVDQKPRMPQFPSHVLWVLERARVRERLGDRDEAIRAYAYVADMWQGADPELQPVVQEARAALARLGVED
jgi:serine/threonine-protein kinase